LAFVHPNPEAQAAAIAGEHGLQDLSRFSDPDGVLYRALGLGRAGIGEFFRWSVIKRYLEAWRAGHAGSKPSGDVLRMPGVFLIDGCKVIREYRHRTPADRPDYTALAGA
jgi:hypothetical protein